MAGYSGTPLPKKLGIREGHRVVVVHGPRGFSPGTLPAGVEVRSDLRGRRPFDVLVLFAIDAGTLTRDFPRLAARMNPAAGLWVAWPKKASGVATDLTGSVVRSHGLGQGLVDNKVCAIDETWSACDS